LSIAASRTAAFFGFHDCLALGSVEASGSRSEAGAPRERGCGVATAQM
jgi:hypothetical protein